MRCHYKPPAVQRRMIMYPVVSVRLSVSLRVNYICFSFWRTLSPEHLQYTHTSRDQQSKAMNFPHEMSCVISLR